MIRRLVETGFFWWPVLILAAVMVITWPELSGLDNLWYALPFVILCMALGKIEDIVKERNRLRDELDRASRHSSVPDGPELLLPGSDREAGH